MRQHQLRTLLPALGVQYGAVSQAQLRAAGVSRAEARQLHFEGWTSPAQGILLEPYPPDPFRAGVAGALLASRKSVACRTTAARLHELWGLPLWTPKDLPHVLLPEGLQRHQRRGMVIHHGLWPGEATDIDGLRVTTLDRTVRDMPLVLQLDDLVCLLDSALRLGWTLPPDAGMDLREAAARTDARSESALESRLRLLFARAGFAPEELQLELFTVDGICYARLDFAWPSRRVAVEADGRETHDAPYALYRDRDRQNDVSIDGWTILRFTWSDLMTRPRWVVQKLRQALAG